MPNIDGKEFLEKSNLKANEDVTVIVCSNTSDQELMKDMIELGAVKVVTKSTLDPRDLIELVKPYFS